MILEDVNFLKGTLPLPKGVQSLPAMVKGGSVANDGTRFIGAIADIVPDASIMSTQEERNGRVGPFGKVVE